MNFKTIFSVLFFAALTTACTTHRFVPVGMTQPNHTKPADCAATILLRAPSDTPYSEIGICMAQTPGGGMISDNTPEAIGELRRCACLSGGDAIILGNSNEAGIVPAWGGYSQQVAKAQGIVIIFENQKADLSKR
jgi:hypothetical protein